MSSTQGNGSLQEKNPASPGLEAKGADKARRFARLVETTFSEVYFFGGDDLRFEYANAAAVKNTGYSLEELRGMTPLDLKAGFTPEAFARLLQPLLDGSRSHVRFETVHRRKDGTTYDCDILLQPLGEPGERAFAAIVRDITEQVTAERALAEKNALLEQLFENAPFAIFLSRRGGRLVRVNPAATDLFGYEPQEWIGRTADELIVPDELKGEGRAFTERLHEARQKVAFESVRKRKDGSLLDVSFIGFPIELQGEVIGGYGIYHDITDRKEAERLLRQSYAEIQKQLLALKRSWNLTIHTLGSVVEARDPYTAGHQKKVALLAGEIAERMGLPDEQVDQVILASLIHDVGKIEIPSEILSKPASLSVLERQLVQTHPETGSRIVAGLQTPWPLGEIVLQHHERLDGSGYPRGLSGDEVLLEARILAVADVVEAMGSHRPYRPAWPIESIQQEMIRQRGIAFDAAVVDAWLELPR